MKKRLRLHFAYANVVSTLALFLVLSGGAAYAATKIHSGDIANGAVKTSKLHKRAVTSGKLAIGAVRSNQIASRGVAPENLQFPVSFVASPSGGSAPVPSGEPISYALADNSWTQGPGQVNVVFGGAAATLAYNGSGSGSCRAFIELRLNGRQVGGGEVSTESTSLAQVEASLGAQPEIDPRSAKTNTLTARVGSNGDCTSSSTVDSSRFRVLDFG